MPPTDRLLTYQEAADIAGVSLAAVKRWAQAREFPVWDGGHRTKRIKLGDLTAFLESRMSPARDKRALTHRLPRDAA